MTTPATPQPPSAPLEVPDWMRNAAKAWFINDANSAEELARFFVHFEPKARFPADWHHKPHSRPWPASGEPEPQPEPLPNGMLPKGAREPDVTGNGAFHKWFTAIWPQPKDSNSRQKLSNWVYKRDMAHAGWCAAPASGEPTASVPPAGATGDGELIGKLVSAGDLTLIEDGEEVKATGVFVQCTREALMGLRGNMLYSEVAIRATRKGDV